MNEIKKFYNTYGIREWKRLIKTPFNKLELDTTFYYLEKYLPKKGLILDAGGGPGRYSILLAKKGYHLVLLDLSRKMLEIAKKKIKEEKVESKFEMVIEGNVTNLSMFKDNTFDATLCLGGVISHLIKKSDRDKAIQELKRVTKKNSPIFISVIGRLGVLKMAPIYFPNEITAKYFSTFRDTGNYYGGFGFTHMHGFLLKDFKELIVKNKLKPIKFIGLEGLSSSIGKYVNRLAKNKKQWEIWINTHYKTCEIPSIVDTSEHILCVCKK
ncbi:MAG: class I SAM-dependent methyltransferase [Candidatus Aenigmatarchaeota archaeon]